MTAETFGDALEGAASLPRLLAALVQLRVTGS